MRNGTDQRKHRPRRQIILVAFGFTPINGRTFYDPGQSSCLGRPQSHSAPPACRRRGASLTGEWVEVRLYVHLLQQDGAGQRDRHVHPRLVRVEVVRPRRRARPPMLWRRLDEHVGGTRRRTRRTDGAWQTGRRTAWEKHKFGCNKFFEGDNNYRIRPN